MDPLVQNVLKTTRSVADPYLAVKRALRRIRLPKNLAALCVGKAAPAMAAAAMDFDLSGLVCCKSIDSDLERKLLSGKFKIFKAGHPVPNSTSEKAAHALREFASRHDDLLVLLSGGGSSLTSASSACSSQDLAIATKYLVDESGLDILELNALRRRINDVVQGGNLLKACRPNARVLTLAISDVPFDSPKTIASGPTSVRNEQDVRACANALSKIDPRKLPQSVLELLKSPDAADATNALPNHAFKTLCTNSDVVEAISRQVLTKAYNKVSTRFDPLQGEVSKVAEFLVDEYERGRVKGRSFAYVAGGETTVRMTSFEGKGGRNQHLALLVSRILSKRRLSKAFCLCFATDGDDGIGGAAGAVVSAKTYENDPATADKALATFDSYGFFNEKPEHLITGATGTNVMDVFVIGDDPSSSSRLAAL